MENKEEMIAQLNDEELETVEGGACPTERPIPGYKWYQIKKGDNLTRIARNFHTTIKDLMLINKGNKGIKDENHIYAGYWIQVPGQY